MNLNDHQTSLEEAKALFSEHPFEEEAYSDLIDFIESIEFIQNLIHSKRKKVSELDRDEYGRAKIDITNPPLFEDMDYFRQPAISYINTGKFTDLYKNGNPNSEYMKFWAEETRRCKEGYIRESDGMWLTGYNYWYLNYSPIMLTEKDGKVNKDGSVRARRVYKHPRPWDMDILYFHYLEQALDAGKHGIVLKARGRGYLQPYSAKILTPKGWTTMGDIKPGDVVNIPNMGLAVVEDKYEHGMKDVYEVELSDGRKTRCGEEHLWAVYKNYSKSNPKPYKVMMLKDIIDDGLYYNTGQGQKSYKYRIPKQGSMIFADNSDELEIHPYLLGLLLGDGTMKTGSVRIATVDQEILDSIQNILGDEYELVKDDSTSCQYRLVYKRARTDFDKINPIRDAIRKLDLEKTHLDKFIPDKYKYTTVHNRMSIVKGLMDTDGSISKDGFVEFTNTSKQLIDDLAEILRSLGEVCSISKEDRTGTYSIYEGRKIDRGVYYRLHIRTNKNIFNLTRKSSRVRKKELFDLPFIKDIKKVGVEESACIYINSDEHIYITDDMIPTHNSFKAGAMLTRNLFLKRKSISYAFAEAEEYLTNDGILNKAWDTVSFVNSFTPFKKHFAPDKMMHKRAAYFDMTDNAYKGYLSEISGVIVNKSDKVRGKRGMLAMFEEAGSFRHLLKSWNVFRSSIEDGGYVFGQAVAFGTGGSANQQNFEALEEMFYNGNGYKILTMRNVFDKNQQNNICGFFVPTYMNRAGCYDNNGNSDIIKALAEVIVSRLIVKYGASDARALTQEKAEHPVTPVEALLKTSNSIFPTAELKDYLTDILPKQEEFVSAHYVGDLVYSGGHDIQWRLNAELEALRTYPVKEVNTNGAVEIYEQPVRDTNGNIPKGRYVMGLDPITISETGSSLLSTFVFDLWNDVFVAEYTGRRQTANETFDIVTKLALYYKATVNYENNLKGYFAYLDHRNLTHLLMDTPQILKDQELIKVKMSWGVSAHPYSETVLTPDRGIIKWEDVNVGDKLYDEKGGITTVIDIPYDNIADVYEITLFDRRKIRCSKDHLWDVYRFGKERTFTTEELIDKYLRKRIRNGKVYYEKLCSVIGNDGVQYDHKDVSLDPYTLGLILGDGSITKSGLKDNGNRIGFTSNLDDVEIYKKLIPYEFTKPSDDRHMYLKINNATHILKELKLYDTSSKTKFIPDEYKYNSKEVRLNLIRGLFDTDGTIEDGLYQSLTTTSKQLSKDVVEVLRSLGVNCKVYLQDTGYKDNDGNYIDCGIGYQITAWTHIKLFNLPRKFNKFRKVVPKTFESRAKSISIIDIKKLDYQEMVKCVTVDNPMSRYLIGDFITTHNSKGSPANKGVNLWARKLLADWMMGKHYYNDENGEEHQTIKLRTLRSLGLIREASQWNPDGNFDRISAAGMVMIAREEMYKYVQGTRFRDEVVSNEMLDNDDFLTMNNGNFGNIEL